ncbi:spermatogenesis-associated protein 20 isoform X1 [Diachasmimorpha longicaudata]|uniref:spermatogenesis-associated protein 20 isoform X1 n=2 Tax=Diachasmimorpha longicaudata TaxID=58733 RepID=UPI0030B89414
MICVRCFFISATRCLSESSHIYRAHKSLGVYRGTLLSAGRKRIDYTLPPALTMASSSHPPPHRNKLALEKSPYLLQHASNPVQWYPWGDEALEKAKREDKLIFLSVGYSTCHWCHVMEHESFENEIIAKIMNTYFVNIKVDREERPDIDKIYMTFVQNIYGHGGWPMSVFLTPSLIPVMGGTYFPPVDKYGQPGFERVLLSLSQKWLENKQELIRSSSTILDILRQSSKGETLSGSPPPSADSGNKCVQQLVRSFDPEFGGFSDAPKFPQPVNLNLLFHMYARDRNSDLGKQCLSMCIKTLKKMANGGIHDHVGQGFSRYSVDGKWHVPHFEKMLYDQGQLLRSYSNAFVATKDTFYSDIIDDIVTYVTRDLRHKEGGYYSAEDADSLPSANARQKKEGAFYVWSAEEIDQLLDKNIKNETRLSDIYIYHYGVKKNGNLEKRQDPHNEMTGKNVLIVYGGLEKTAEHFKISVDELKGHLKDANKILFEERSKRPRPHLDDKIVTAWNGLMISGLSYAGAAMRNKDYVQYAVDAAKFTEKYLFDKDKRVLLRSCYRGDNDVITQPGVPINGFHGDYAFMVQGLIDLYTATLDSQWLVLAEELQDVQDELFWDAEGGGYFNTTKGEKNIILRLKDEHDGAEPSSNSVAANNLLRLASLLDRKDYNEKAEAIFKHFSDTLTRIPVAVPELGCALLHYHDATTQLYIAGKKDAKDTQELLDVIRDRLIPSKVLLLIDPDDTDSIISRKNELVLKMKPHNGRATIFVCRHRTCSLPIVEPQQLKELLDSAK